MLGLQFMPMNVQADDFVAIRETNEILGSNLVPVVDNHELDESVAESVESIESAASAESAESVESIESAASAESVESIESAASIVSAGSA